MSVTFVEDLLYFCWECGISSVGISLSGSDSLIQNIRSLQAIWQMYWCMCWSQRENRNCVGQLEHGCAEQLKQARVSIFWRILLFAPLLVQHWSNKAQKHHCRMPSSYWQYTTTGEPIQGKRKENIEIQFSRFNTFWVLHILKNFQTLIPDLKSFFFQTYS